MDYVSLYFTILAAMFTAQAVSLAGFYAWLYWPTNHEEIDNETA